MGIKQLRLGKDQILSNKESLIDEKCSIVFSNGSSLFIQLIKFDNQYLYGKDMFTKKRKFALTDITEIIRELRD